MVKERILASWKVEPGALIWIKAIRATWSSLSPTWEIICPIQSKKKFLSFRMSANLAT
jgi:hypothetical protein